MQVFLSWSKSRSRGVAEVLRAWLPEVIQQLDPWMSSEDIDKGQRWSPEIAARLESTSQGLICVTPDNLVEPWLNFEAGALAKAVEDARVRPLLFDLQPADVTGPLAQFQATELSDKQDMLRVVASLNAACERPLAQDRLERAFDRTWPDLQDQLEKVRAATTSEVPAPARSAEDKIDEALAILRRIDRTPPEPVSGPAEWVLESNPRSRAERPVSRRGARGMTRLASSVAVGTLMEHDEFGTGRVRDVRGEGDALQALVDFGGVSKWLLLKYAPVRLAETSSGRRPDVAAGSSEGQEDQSGD